MLEAFVFSAVAVEAAQLGTLGALRQAVTLLRGYGLQVWSFWQDLSQVRNLYPQDWQTKRVTALAKETPDESWRRVVAASGAMI